MRTEDETDGAEASSWLERSDGKDRTISKDREACLQTEHALRLVRELYAMGAVEVLAHNVMVEYEFENADSLTVLLPNDPKKRAALFALQSRVLNEMGSHAIPQDEQGQVSFTLGW